MRDLPNTECSVYVIGFDLDKAPSKVGIAVDPPKRLASLQTAHFQRLKLAGGWATPDRECARALEEAFHHTQRKARLSGEWFDLSPKQCMILLKIGYGVMLNVAAGLEPEEVDTILADAEWCA